MTRTEALELANYYLKESQKVIENHCARATLEQAEQMFEQEHFWQIIVESLNVAVQLNGRVLGFDPRHDCSIQSTAARTLGMSVVKEAAEKDTRKNTLFGFILSLRGKTLRSEQLGTNC